MILLNKHHSITRPVVLFNQISNVFSFELAKLFANCGFDLIFSDLDLIENEKITELQRYENEVIKLSFSENIDQMIKEIEYTKKKIDVLIMILPEKLKGPLTELDENKIRTYFQKDLGLNIELLKYVLALMKMENHGKIFISNGTGPVDETPYESISGATRAFLISLLSSLRLEHRDSEISFTSFYDNLHSKFNKKKSYDKMSERYIAEECFYAILSSRKSVFNSSFGEKIDNLFRHKVIDQTLQLFLN